LGLTPLFITLPDYFAARGQDYLCEVGGLADAGHATDQHGGILQKPLHVNVRFDFL
jgi:hypothetical protein